MVAAGELKDYADAARVLGCTRSRVAQITSLLLLAPAIQEAIVDLPMSTGRDWPADPVRFLCPVPVRS